MSKVKKILAVVLSMAMIMGMSITSFAATTPSSADKATATVNNVEAGLTVTAYKILKANYSNGFTGYSWTAASGLTKDVFNEALISTENPNGFSLTDADITAIASDPSKLGTGIPMTGTGTTYTADLEAGAYVVLVTGTNGKDVYNPMLVSVYYSKSGSENDMSSDAVSADANWTLSTKDAYAKSTTPSVEKTITNSGSSTNKGDASATGTATDNDKIGFQIKTKIPSYSAEYSHATFVITDTLTAGITSNKDVTVTTDAEGNNAIDASAYEITYDGQVMKVTFTSAYVLANGLQDVYVKYTGYLNENAVYNFDANTNTAYATYTNDPSETADAKKTTDTPESVTYHYTFGIDANLYGTGGALNQKTEEIVKVDEKGNVIITDSKTTTVEDGKYTEVATGATFTITNNTTGKVYTATTDENGHLEFTGLDVGTYTLVETVAPTGYSLDTTPHTVIISATFIEAEGADQGKLESYSIKIDDNDASTYTATYDKGIITNINKVTHQTQIKNTKLNSLPSTGGIGTTIFTLGGCAIMIIAAFLYFRSRKKVQ